MLWDLSLDERYAHPGSPLMRTLRNGVVVREGTTADLLVSPWELVSFVSRVMTLLPGDVVLTGAPTGGEPLAPGDEVRVEIEDVGILINGVRAAPARDSRAVIQ